MTILRTPDSDDGGDNAAVDPILAGTAPDADANGEQQTNNGDGDNENGEGEPQAKYTRDDLTAILQSVLPAATATRQQPQQQQRQLTQDELDEALNVWKPSASLLKDFRSEDEAVAHKALLSIRDGVMKQATTIFDARLKQERAEIDEKHLTPMSAFMEEQRAERLEREFYASNKDLEQHGEIVNLISARIAPGFQGTKQQLFAATAKASREFIKRIGAGGGQQNSNGPANGARGQRRMSSLSGGGQGGGGNGSGTPAGLPGMHIFKD